MFINYFMLNLEYLHKALELHLELKDQSNDVICEHLPQEAL